MGDTIPLDELLGLWAFHHMPDLLADDDVFDAMLAFIHALLRKAVQEERRATMRRVLRVTPA